MRRPISSPHRLAVGIAVTLVLTGLLGIVLADPVAPKARDREIAITVTSKLKTEHISKHPLDDEILAPCRHQVRQDPRPCEGVLLPVGCSDLLGAVSRG